MNLKKIFTFLIITLLAISSSHLLAQTLEETYEKAKLAERKKDYDGAYLLHKRCYFFSTDSSQKNIFRLNLAVAAFHAGNYAETVELLSQPNQFPPRKTDHEIIRLAAMLNLSQWELVQTETDSIEYWETDSVLIANGLFFRLLSQIQLNQRDQAIRTAKILKNYAKMNNSSSFDSLLIVYQKDKFPDAKRSGNLSLMLPGLGQLYAKDTRNALNAFVLNGSLISAMILTANTYSWPMSVLFWVYYVPHYYFGNARAARDIAIEKSREKRIYYENQFKLLAQ